MPGSVLARGCEDLTCRLHVRIQARSLRYPCSVNFAAKSTARLRRLGCANGELPVASPFMTNFPLGFSLLYAVSVLPIQISFLAYYDLCCPYSTRQQELDNPACSPSFSRHGSNRWKGTYARPPGPQRSRPQSTKLWDALQRILKLN